MRKPDDRRLMLVLADRASLGDTDGAERDLRESRLVQRPAFFHYTQARIAWSRGDAKAALALYDQAANDAADEGLGGMEAEASELAGRPRRLRRASRWRRRRARPKLRDAAAIDVGSAPRAALRLLAIRMRSPEWQRWSIDPIAADPERQPVLSLIRAREAWFRNDLETARRELRRSRAEGIDTSEIREEAELLAAELGLPSQALPPDPPYPNVLRFLAIFDGR